MNRVMQYRFEAGSHAVPSFKGQGIVVIRASSNEQQDTRVLMLKAAEKEARALGMDSKLVKILLTKILTED